MVVCEIQDENNSNAAEGGSEPEEMANNESNQLANDVNENNSKVDDAPKNYHSLVGSSSINSNKRAKDQKCNSTSENENLDGGKKLNVSSNSSSEKTTSFIKIFKNIFKKTKRAPRKRKQKKKLSKKTDSTAPNSATKNDRMKNLNFEEKFAEESSLPSSSSSTSKMCQKPIHNESVSPSSQISSDVSKKDLKTSISKNKQEKICSTSSVESPEEPSISQEAKLLSETKDEDLTETDSGGFSANKNNLISKTKERPVAVVPPRQRENDTINELCVATPQPYPATTPSNHISPITASNQQSSPDLLTSTPVNQISNQESITAIFSSTTIYQNQSTVQSSFETIGSIQIRTKKFKNFVSNPRNDRPVTYLPGVGKKGGERLRAVGIHTVNDMFQKYQTLGGDESSFKSWFENETSLNNYCASQCYDALGYM